MKNVFFVNYIALFALFASCGSAPQTTAIVSTPVPDELDVAIRETSNYLNKQLPKGNKLVILNIQSDFPALSEYIIDELIANTVNDKVFSVVDRQQLNTIRAELDFQMSGEVDDSTAQALGRMAGAQIIISGAVSQIGNLYRMRIRALSVENAQITGQFNRNIPEGTTVSALVMSKATGYGDTTPRSSRVSAATSPTTPARTQSASSAASSRTAIETRTPPPAPLNLSVGTVESTTVVLAWTSAGSAERFRVYFGTTADDSRSTLAGNANSTTYTVTNLKRNTSYYFWVTSIDESLESSKSEMVSTKTTNVYNIGDTGPAGGLIFFDMGFEIDGWRYLEAAPQDFPGGVQWGAYGQWVGTITALGSGKKNTQIIISALKNNGETLKAAQVADAASYGGFNDWFLPSRDELDLMYKNLKQKHMGNFKNSLYWSSSEIKTNYVLASNERNNGGFAWLQNFGDGYQTEGSNSGNGKNDSYSVRAIRRF